MLNRMGAWFGIIFKLVIPALVIYRPIKTFALSVTMFGMEIYGPSQSVSNLGIVIFYLIYAILIIMLILFPKIASAMEFVLIFYYFAFLGALYFIDYFSTTFAQTDQIFHTYIREIPLVLVFLAGKIFFFIFIKKNKTILDEETNASYQSQM